MVDDQPQDEDKSTIIFLELLPLLLLLFVGYFSGKRHLVSDDHLGGINHFLFNIALPASVFQYLVSYRFWDLHWQFVAAFFLYKLFFAVFALGIALVKYLAFHRRQKWQGVLVQEFVRWFMISSLGNTIIVGYPVVMALFGKPYGAYCFMAVIIDQWTTLPISRILLSRRSSETLEVLMHHKDRTSEVSHKSETVATDASFSEYAHGHSIRSSKQAPQQSSQVPSPLISDHENEPQSHNEESPQPQAAESRLHSHDQTRQPRWRVYLESVRRIYRIVANFVHPDIEESMKKAHEQRKRDLTTKWGLVKSILFVFINPLIIATILGSIYSVTTLPTPNILNNFLSFLSNCLSGMGIFTVGLFLSHNSLSEKNFNRLSIALIIKHLLSPLVLLLFALLMGMRGVDTQVAAVIGALPLAISSFIFHMEYNLQDLDILSSCIMVGNLILPVLLSLLLPVIQQIPWVR